jgi:hypothetical protein
VEQALPIQRADHPHAIPTRANPLRLYVPLTPTDLPQSAVNTKGADRLGFAGKGFRLLLAGVLSPLDLRVGAVFSGAAAAALHQACAMLAPPSPICRLAS